MSCLLSCKWQQFQLQCQCHRRQRKAPLNLRSHVGTDLEPCLEKLRHTWRVFNKRLSALGVWLSSVLGSSTWDKVGSFKLWWRLRSCHCNCDVCWGLKWSLAQPWLIFNWHSSPHCLPLHLTTESSDLGQIYNCSQRYIYDLIMFYTILNNYCSHDCSNNPTFTNWPRNVVCGE